MPTVSSVVALARRIPRDARITLLVGLALWLTSTLQYHRGYSAAEDAARLTQDRATVKADMKERDQTIRAADEKVDAATRQVKKARSAHDGARIDDSTHVAITSTVPASAGAEQRATGDGLVSVRIVEVPVEVTRRMIADSLALMAQDSAIAGLQKVVVIDAKTILDLKAEVAHLEEVKAPKLVGVSAVVTGAAGGAAVGALLGGGVGALIGAPAGALFGFGVHILFGGR